jgi:NitT/TauT family transport system substrate-binding protein
MRKRHVHNSVISVVLSGMLLLLIYTIPATAEASQPEPVKLKVLVLLYLDFAPFFIAQEEGYFAEQGLKVEFIKMDSGPKTIPSLLQGDLDVLGGIVHIGILNAIARGGTLKVVADKGHIDASPQCADHALLARRALVETGELQDPAHLKGRQIAVNPESTDGYCLEKVLRTANLTLADVSAKYVPPATRLEGLATGALDVIYASEPWLTRNLQAGKAVVWKPVKDIIPEFQLAVILYGPTLLTQNPEAGRRFMVSYLKAVRQYNQGKTERNLEIIAKHTGLERDLLQAMCWPYIYNDGHINTASMLDLQQWWLEKKLLDQLVREDQFWDGSFIEYANQSLGPSAE